MPTRYRAPSVYQCKLSWSESPKSRQMFASRRSHVGYPFHRDVYGSVSYKPIFGMRLLMAPLVLLDRHICCCTPSQTTYLTIMSTIYPSLFVLYSIRHSGTVLSPLHSYLLSIYQNPRWSSSLINLASCSFLHFHITFSVCRRKISGFVTRQGRIESSNASTSAILSIPFMVLGRLTCSFCSSVCSFCSWH